MCAASTRLATCGQVAPPDEPPADPELPDPPPSPPVAPLELLPEVEPPPDPELPPEEALPPDEELLELGPPASTCCTCESLVPPQAATTARRTPTATRGPTQSAGEIRR